jgi:hypothetical protein
LRKALEAKWQPLLGNKESVISLFPFQAYCLFFIDYFIYW